MVTRFFKNHVAFIGFLGLMSGLYSSTLDSHGMFVWDEATYASIGRSVFQGGGFSVGGEPDALRPPVLPLSGSVAMLISGSQSDKILKIPVLLFAILALSILYGTVSLEYGRQAGLMAAIFLGFAPSFWIYTSYFLSEIPFLAFFLGAVFFMYHGLYLDKKYFLASWACFGLSLLTRYTGVLFCPITLVMVTVALFRGQSQDEIKKRIFSRHFFLSPLIAIGILAPWLLRQQLTFGDALIGFKTSAGQLIQYLPTESMPALYYFQGMPSMITRLGTVALIICVVWAIKKKDNLSLHAVFVGLFILIWFSIYRYKEIRIITSILPFAAAVCGIGTHAIFRLLLPRVPAKVGVLLAGIVLGIFSYRATIPRISRSFANGFPVLTEAIDGLKSSAPKSDIIMSAISPQMAWYSGMQTRSFPLEEELKTVLETVDWVFIVNFERGQQDWVTELIRLFSEEDQKEGLIQVVGNGRYGAFWVRSDVLLSRLSGN